MLAQNENLSEEARRLRAIFDGAREWLLSGETDFALQADEIEIAAQNDRLVLSCLTAQGWETRRVENWENKNGKIIFLKVKIASRRRIAVRNSDIYIYQI